MRKVSLSIVRIRAKEGSFPGVDAVVTFGLGFIAKSPFLQITWQQTLGRQSDSHSSVVLLGSIFLSDFLGRLGNP